VSFYRSQISKFKFLIRAHPRSSAVTLSLLFFLTAHSFAEPVDVLMESLSREFSAIRTVQTQFVETKQIRILDQTLELSGSLAIEKPERLAWRVEEPLACTVIVADGRVRQWDEDSGKTESFSSRSNPVFAMVLDQMRNWFSGDFASLQTDYDVHIEQHDPPVLRFTPRTGSPNAQVIRTVRVAIRDDLRYVQSIGITDSSGDETNITFIDTVLNEPVPPETWRIQRNAP
jgi:outer membrane lipoprotein carrier protein